MSNESSTRHAPLELRTTKSDDANVYEAVRRITRIAFLINPETGLRIEGDTPTELPLVEALFARNAVDHLHIATLNGEIVAYVL
ncbi:MAG: hypothetical protein MUC50_23510, partial [Myxococcota bacterium]|nr:hypothetical protein [Myxococcota bacterium]